MFNVLTKIIHFINNQKKKQENISFQRFPTVVILLIVHIKIRILLFSDTDDTDLHGPFLCLTRHSPTWMTR